MPEGIKLGTKRNRDTSSLTPGLKSFPPTCCWHMLIRQVGTKVKGQGWNKVSILSIMVATWLPGLWPLAPQEPAGVAQPRSQILES